MPPATNGWAKNGKTNRGTFSPFLRLATSKSTGNTPATTATVTAPLKLCSWGNESSLCAISHSTNRKRRSSGLRPSQERASSPCASAFIRLSHIHCFIRWAASRSLAATCSESSRACPRTAGTCRLRLAAKRTWYHVWPFSVVSTMTPCSTNLFTTACGFCSVWRK